MFLQLSKLVVLLGLLLSYACANASENGLTGPGQLGLASMIDAYVEEGALTPSEFEQVTAVLKFIATSPVTFISNNCLDDEMILSGLLKVGRIRTQVNCADGAFQDWATCQIPQGMGNGLALKAKLVSMQAKLFSADLGEDQLKEISEGLALLKDKRVLFRHAFEPDRLAFFLSSVGILTRESRRPELFVCGHRDRLSLPSDLLHEAGKSQGFPEKWANEPRKGGKGIEGFEEHNPFDPKQQ